MRRVGGPGTTADFRVRPRARTRGGCAPNTREGRGLDAPAGSRTFVVMWRMWTWLLPWTQAHVLDERGVTFGLERFSFAELADASLVGGVLTLRDVSGRERRLRVRGGFALLEAILDGIRRSHPEASIYRTAALPFVVQNGRSSRLRRRVATAGKPDLWLGRTLYK